MHTNLHDLPDAVFEDVMNYLSLQDIRSIHLVNRSCSQRILKLHPWSRKIHNLWIKNKPTWEYRFRRLWIRWEQSVMNMFVWWILGGFLIPIVCGCASLSNWIIAMFTFDAAHLHKHSHFVVQIDILRKSAITGRKLHQVPLKRGTKAGGLIAMYTDGTIAGPFHPFNCYANILWLVSGGLLVSVVHLVVALLQAMFLLGLPNVMSLLVYAKIFLWPFGFEYIPVAPTPIPPVDPRLSSLRLFLEARLKERRAREEIEKEKAERREKDKERIQEWEEKRARKKKAKGKRKGKGKGEKKKDKGKEGGESEVANEEMKLKEKEMEDTENEQEKEKRKEKGKEKEREEKGKDKEKGAEKEKRKDKEKGKDKEKWKEKQKDKIKQKEKDIEYEIQIVVDIFEEAKKGKVINV